MIFSFYPLFIISAEESYLYHTQPSGCWDGLDNRFWNIGSLGIHISSPLHLCKDGLFSMKNWLL